MANYDYLLVYSDEIERWLQGEGCCVPSVLPGNRNPTMQEMVAAVEAEGLRAVVEDEEITVVPPANAPALIHGMTRAIKYVEVRDGELIESRPPLSYLARIHSFHWDELNANPNASITMRGNFALELFIVRNLAERCGQLVLYPDTGDPPVVVESDDDIGHAASIWLDAVKAETSWAEFYQRVKIQR